MTQASTSGRRPRAQVFVDHNIIIRHFLHSGTIQRPEEEFDVEYVFPANDNRVTNDIHAPGLPRVREIPVNRKRINQLRPREDPNPA